VFLFAEVLWGGLCYDRYMAGWIHRLSNIDADGKTADCLKCGRVDVKLKKNKAPRCIVAHREEKKKYSVYKYRDRHPGRPDMCDVCGSAERICWDHDHQTGVHRGWLCNKCNSALGFVGDNVETLEKLIKYLKR